MTSASAQIGDLGPGDYNITAAGQGGLSFQNTTALEYVHKSYSVFIQTDKAIYKPGDLVRFRAVVLNPSLRPHTAGNLNAWVTVSTTSCYLNGINTIQIVAVKAQCWLCV